MIRKIILFLLFLALLQANAGTITLINLSNFADPVSLRFDSLANGNISGTDSIFQTVGISSVSATSTGGITDNYDSYNDGRALFFDGQLYLNVYDGGARKHASGTTVFTLNLLDYYNKIAFIIPDYNTPLTATFYYNGANVGSYTTTSLNPSSTIALVGFQNTSAFNQVVLTGSTDGYGISQITMESLPVPEISSWILVALFGFIGYFSKKKILNKILFCFFIFFTIPLFAETTTINILSDTTWKAANSVSSDWLNLNYNDSSWGYANIVQSGSYNSGLYIWKGSLSDTNNTAYFRKSINIIGDVLSASLSYHVDDDVRFYINGVNAYEESSGGANTGTISINANLFNSGNNLIAFYATDSNLYAPTQQGAQYLAFNLALTIEVPEPASFALLAIFVLGCFSIKRFL